MQPLAERSMRMSKRCVLRLSVPAEGEDGVKTGDRARGVSYHGEWHGDKKNGYGVQVFPNGDKYEGWLSDVEILKNLNHFELAKLADALETECFDAGEDIIKQGEVGEKFYILEDGKAAAFISGGGGEKEVKKYEKQGDYFGEIALLTAEPRKATVRASGEGCSVVSLSKENFTSILGPITDILKKHVDMYPQYADFLK